jgi:hypothetical protein
MKSQIPHIINIYLGGNLRQYLKDYLIKLTWLDRVVIARGIALGIQHLHDKGILHRDIKSRNILLERKKNIPKCMKKRGKLAKKEKEKKEKEKKEKEKKKKEKKEKEKKEKEKKEKERKKERKKENNSRQTKNSKVALNIVLPFLSISAKPPAILL